MSDQDKRLGVYFHIPFCASKCAYCDFCSLPGRDKLMPYYQDALLIQLQETMPRMTDYFIDTVYFGGGTPSYYGARRIVEILQELKVTNRLMKQSEITVECNPDSVRRKELRMLRKEGVNLIACPTCGRTRIDLIGLAHQVEDALQGCQKDITVAVMGCAVNGPGEAREADLGVAGGEGEGLLFKKGKILRKVPEDQLLPALLEEVEKL